MSGAVPPPGPHGGDAHRLAQALGRPVEAILDLSASLNPHPPDCRSILQDALDDLGRYPDDSCATRALADVIGVGAERLVLTNGGAEAIALVAAVMPVGWADQRDFSLYRRHLTRIEPDGPRWMSDPNNPTGALAPTSERAAVRDEAFYLLATGTWTRGDEGCTVVGSLTKAWALPGLRIGYVLAPDADTADHVRARRPRWSVNGVVCRALPQLLELAEPETWRDRIAVLRQDLVSLLSTHGITAAPSDANYVWVPAARGMRARLARRGVLVRDGTSFGAPDAIRIAVPDEAGLLRLRAALETTDDREEPR